MVSGRKVNPVTKKKVRTLHQEGWSNAEIARTLEGEVSKWWITYYVKHLREQGLSLDSLPKYGEKRWPGADKTPADVEAEWLGPIPVCDLSDVAKDCLEDFGRFRARYLGAISIAWQEEAAYRVLDGLESPDDRYGVINCPQGSGKTKLFSHDIPAWLTARDRTLRGILGSASLTVSSSLTDNLKTTFERKTPQQARRRMAELGLAIDAQATLAADYGMFKPPAAESIWRRDRFTVAQHEGVGATADKESTWAAFSHEAKFLSWRVDFMNWDDVHDSKLLANPDAMESLFDWWDNEAESRLDPGGLCLVTMQRLGARDISRYLLDKVDPDFEIDADRPEDAPRQYFHVVYKAHYDDRCEGAHGGDAPSWPEGCMLDPKRITSQKIAAKKTAGNYEVVYQQEDADPGEVLVPKLWIDGGTNPDTKETHPGCWDTDRDLAEIPVTGPGQRLSVASIDPSPTKWWSVQWWLYHEPPEADAQMGFRYLLDLHRAKMSSEDLLDWNVARGTWTGLLENWWQRSRDLRAQITHLVVEQNGAQRFMLRYDWFRRWLSLRGVALLPHDTSTNKNTTEYGVSTIAPHYRYGRVRLPGTWAARKALSPMVSELTHYPDYPTDDCVLANWFFEFKLPHIRRAPGDLPSTYRDMPSWLGPPKQSSAIERVNALIAEALERPGVAS